MAGRGRTFSHGASNRCSTSPATEPCLLSCHPHDNNIIDPAFPDCCQNDHIIDGRDALAALPFADCGSADSAGIRNIRNSHPSADSLIPDVPAGCGHVYRWHFLCLLSSGSSGVSRVRFELTHNCVLNAAPLPTPVPGHTGGGSRTHRTLFLSKCALPAHSHLHSHSRIRTCTV